MQGNRWHFARRWARILPVTLVQARLDLMGKPSIVVDEPRIPGARILYVGADPIDSPCALAGLSQVHQIFADMSVQGYQRPILWAYDPQYLPTYTMLPAVMRVYHATENYYSFPNMTDKFMGGLSAMVRQSDMVIAVSDGVAQSFQVAATRAVTVSPNGCDYSFYAAAVPDPEVQELSRQYSRIAIYGGNINDRINLKLLETALERFPDIAFVLIGPAHHSETENKTIWARLQKAPNFHYFGPVSSERLASCYAAADIGLAPYYFRPDLLDNLFPLKIFEMTSTGLPVVSSPFASLRPFAQSTLFLAESEEAFLSALSGLGRKDLTASEQAALRELSQAQDYDARFERVRDLVLAGCQVQASSPVLSAFSLTGGDALTEWLRRVPMAAYVEWEAPSQLFIRWLRKVVKEFAAWSDRVCPPWLNGLIQGALKQIKTLSKR